jgi:hypothetical protein
MSGASSLKRRAFLVDEQRIRKARKVLGVATDAEAIRLSVERVLEMDKSRGTMPPGSFDAT